MKFPAWAFAENDASIRAHMRGASDHSKLYTVNESLGPYRPVPDIDDRAAAKRVREPSHRARRPGTVRGDHSFVRRRAAPMEIWVIWLIIAVALGIAEIFTLTAALGLLGGAAVITSVAAAAGLPIPVQLAVFAASSVAGIVLVRPVAARLLIQRREHAFGVDALVGRAAYVLQEVTGQGGRVRIGGEEWSARSFDETVVIPAGTTVDVIQIEGATALVYPRE